MQDDEAQADALQLVCEILDTMRPLMEFEIVAKWKVYKGENVPRCTSCGMGMPFAKYRKEQGVNARDITDFCPNCGAQMFAIDECKTCKYSKDGNWQENGICYTCRDDVWIFGKKHNERILKDKNEYRANA